MPETLTTAASSNGWCRSENLRVQVDGYPPAHLR